MSAPGSQERRQRGPLRAAIYIRVSTAMQRMEGWSLDAQRASLTAFAQGRGWKLAGVYADEGKSARKRLKDRREIFRLLDDVKAGKVDVILFKELDRWFRNVSDFYKVQDILDEAGVFWVSERQPSLDMTTKEGRLAVNVLLSVGQNEADATSDRIKYTTRFLVAQHRWPAGARTLPRGYTVDEDQHVIIDPAEEPFVRDLLLRFRQTGNFRASLLASCAAFNTEWFYSAARRWLNNPMLCGEYRGHADFVAAPYLTRDEWEDLQLLIRRNIRTGVRRCFPFSGLAICGICGRRMAGGISGWPAVPGYRCNAASVEGRHAANSITEKKLERLLLPFVREALDGQILRLTAMEAADRPVRPAGNRAQIERKLDRLEDVYINSERMTKERYEAKRAAILAQLVEEPVPAVPSVDDLRRLRSVFSDSFDEIYTSLSAEEKRTFWRGVLDHVTIRHGAITDVAFLA